MRRFVFWSGVYNIVLGIASSFPAVVSLLGIKLPESNMWLWFPGALVFFLGIMLVLCSRNLAARASLVYWEGILRIATFFVFAGYGLWGGLGVALGVFGLVDLLIGLVYLVGLPRARNTTAVKLLLDRAT